MERPGSGVLSRSRAKTASGNGSSQQSEEDSSDEDRTHGTEFHMLLYNTLR